MSITVAPTPKSQKEASVFYGSPIELYLFSNGETVWAVTSGEDPITINLSAATSSATKVLSLPAVADVAEGNITFAPIPISRTEASNTQELNKSNIEITVPRTFGVAQLHSSFPPSAITAITVYRFHRGLGLLESNLQVEWMGRVINSSGAGISSVLRCEPISVSVRRIGISDVYQRQCGAVLYDTDTCRAPRVATNNVVSNISGLDITFNDTMEAHLFSGGMLHWVSHGFTYWRWILDNDADWVRINYPIPLLDPNEHVCLPLSTSIVLYKGCNHTLTECRVKFNNLNNYQGTPYIPLINPFNGATLY